MLPALLLAVAAVGACAPDPQPPSALELVDWSGRDGHSVPLDQPLVLTFSEELATPVRPSWIRLLREDGTPCRGISLEARGSLLLVHPRLPLRADLEDAGLPPGRDLQLWVSGLPRLQALAGLTGARLLGDLKLPLRTMSASDPAAMSGFPATRGQIRVLDLNDFGVLRWGSVRQGPARLRFDLPLDPRSMQDPALLVVEASTDPQDRNEPLRVALTLVQNASDGAVLELDLGDWTGRGLLTLPEGMEGLGGVPVGEGSRRIRVSRGP